VERQPLELELIAAAEGGDLSSLRKALAQGTRIDARDARGRTALLAAMQSNRGEAVKALLEAMVLSDGGPPHQRIVQMLVEYKADVNLADRNGVTPLGHARTRGFREIERILARAGAR